MERGADTGATLIEMLVALALAALVGLAGFTLLQSVTRTEAALAGRLEALAAQDRAFRLIALDAEDARTVRMTEGGLFLRANQRTAIWRGSEVGLTRRLEFADRTALDQRLLDTPVTISQDTHGLIVVELTEQGVRRLFRAPSR